MQIEIKGKVSNDPRDRVLALEAVARAICERAGQDPADCTMMLLTAAVHMASTYSRPTSFENRMNMLAKALGAATVAADDFFKLRPVTSEATSTTPPHPPSQPSSPSIKGGE